MVNGIQGSDVRYGDKEWRGFSGADLNVTIDLGAEMPVRMIETRCFQGQGQRIYLPDQITVRFSTDGTVFSNAQKMERYAGTGKVFSYRLALSDTHARYVRVEAKNMGKIPEGMQGAGSDAWLFVDEIVVH